MTKILIDVSIASDAIKWAAVQFGNTFTVNNDFPSEKYRFEFDDPDQATVFALKWM
jgi:hypothetical protein